MAALIAVLTLAAACTGSSPPPVAKRPLASITGKVIALDGAPIAGAAIQVAGETATTDQNGWFSLPLLETAQTLPFWVTARRSGFLTRTRAAAPGDPVLIRLTPDDGRTVSLHFGGDVMFGRRFYDPDQDGDTSDGLLHPGDGVAAHLALLSGVQPLLSTADVTVVNMETPLVEQPYIDPTQPRPPSFHPSKSFVFASAAPSAQALREAGVDVVDIGNNHLYDALDPGVTSTIQSLERAGFSSGSGYFGGGRNEDDAWKPAVIHAKGQTIAFLGCTSVVRPFERLGPTIAGRTNERPIPGATTYVAHNGAKGGAAACEVRKIEEAVRNARSQFDVVVFMVHGGIEYWPLPSPVIQQMSYAAVRAGASLVIDGHPHVVGGVGLSGRSLIAWSMGNLLFDQEVWPTFQSYLFDVDIRDGRVLQAYAEPLMIQGYQPQGVTGSLAAYVARTAAGREQIPATIEDGAAEFDIAQHAMPNARSQFLSGEGGRGSIYQLPGGAWASSFSGPGNLEVGRDLLWVGSFEDEDVDQDHAGPPLWNIEAGGVEFSAAAAFAGKDGARLIRQAGDCVDAILTPLHRILVEPGKGISVIGMIRPNRGADTELQLNWYLDLKGSPLRRIVRKIEPASDGGWRPFRFDVKVPPRTVAAGLYIRLNPPEAGTTTADVDDLRIIEWEAQGTTMTPLYGYVRLTGGGRVGMSDPYLPGAQAWSTSGRLEEVDSQPSDYLSGPAPASPEPAGCQTGE